MLLFSIKFLFYVCIVINKLLNAKLHVFGHPYLFQAGAVYSNRRGSSFWLGNAKLFTL